MEKKLSIKNLRKETGLTQQLFAEKYHIPVQTLKQWEATPGSTSHRRPPDYVIYLLGKLLAYENVKTNQYVTNREENLLLAAELSRNDARLWFRYLRKEFEDGRIRLSVEQLANILNSGRLTMYQRISLLRAIQPGTDTNRYVLSLNERATTPMIETIRRRHIDDR